MTGPHDVVESVALAGDRWKVRCACGRETVRSTREAATEGHTQHFQIQKARAALQEGHRR